MSQNEVLEGLAGIVNEVAGVPVEDVQPDKAFVDDNLSELAKSADTSRYVL